MYVLNEPMLNGFNGSSDDEWRDVFKGWMFYIMSVCMMTYTRVD